MAALSGGLHPADLPSRGIEILDIKRKKMWLEGPEFLGHTQERWPHATLAQETNNKINQDNGEEMENVSVNANLVKMNIGMS